MREEYLRSVLHYVYYIIYFTLGGLVVIVMREEYLWTVPHYVYYIIYFTLGGLVIIVMREEQCLNKKTNSSHS